MLAVLLALGILPAGCRSSSEPTPEAPAPAPAPVQEAPEAPSVKPLDEKGLLVAREPRRKESVRYGAMTQDNLILVARCGDALVVPTMVGVLDLPYDNPRGLVAIAEASAEKALASEAAPEGCRFTEASYWTRDQEGGGDWVVRYPTTPGIGSSVWWAPDAGEPAKRSAEAVPPSVYVGRLLRVAAYHADVAEDLDAALAHIRAARAMDPGSRRAVELEAELLLGVDSKKAVEVLDAFMKDKGASPDLQATLATALLDTGDEAAVSRAEGLLDAVLAAEPGNLKALAARGERQRAKGQVDEAIATYEKAVAAHPLDPSPRYNLATLLLAKGDKEAALGHLDAYLAAFPEDPDALFLRAGLHADAGRLEQAVKDLTVLRRVAPGDPQVQALGERLGKAE
jgi:tetratricopeptide (TPR) repeat protein